MNRAAAALVHGQMAEGWNDLEYRWQTPTFVRRYRQPLAPVWDGAAHADDSLLVRWEQAFGDALMCARLLPLLAERFAGRVIVECHPAVGRLLARVQGVAAVVPFLAKGAAGGWPSHQWQVGLLSLPKRLAITSYAAIPQPACLPPVDRAHTAVVVPAGQGPAIGLCWGGGRSRAIAR